MKKGDLSINIIIVAAIALIILVIISVLVFRSGGQIGTQTSCQGIGGNCVSDDDCSYISEQSGESYTRHLTAKCGQDQICCVKV